MIILSSQTLSYDGGVLCCAASDIEIKYQVSQFEMHFRDFSSFSSQCYICKIDHIKEEELDPGVERKKSPLTLGTLRRGEVKG